MSRFAPEDRGQRTEVRKIGASARLKNTIVRRVAALVFCFLLSTSSFLLSSDKLAGGIKAGSTSVSLPVELRKSADSTALTGIVYTGVTGSYWRQGGTRTAITTATLGSVNAAYSSGGFVEVDATNMPGVYRLDVPDAAFATGADWVVVSLKVATAFQQNFMFALESVGAAEVKVDSAAIKAKTDNLPASPASTTNITAGTITTVTTVGTVTTLTNLPAAPTDWLTAAVVKADAVTKIQSGLSTYAGGDTSGTTTLLSRLTSTRAGYLDNISVAPPTLAQIVAGIWDESLSTHTTNGTAGKLLSSAGTSTDPWSVQLPASYLGHSAGAIVGKLDLINPGAVTVVSPTSVAGNVITVRAGDSWSIPINGLGNIGGRTKLWFAINKSGAPDSAALIFVEATGGLTVVNGASYATTSHGSITVNDQTAGNVMVAINKTATALLRGGDSTWAVKMLDSAGIATTLVEGPFKLVRPDINATQ